MLAFVYGTLTDPDRVAALVDEFAYEGAATVRGLHRVDGEYPTLAPGGTTDGRLLRTDDEDALDRYEGVPTGLYVRVPVPVVGRPETATVYVGTPDRLGVGVDWPGTGSFEECVQTYVREQDVTVVPA